MAKKKDEITIRSSAAEYLTYVASVGDQQDSIEMCYEDENIWLTQKMMATLYDVDVRTINEHMVWVCRMAFPHQKLLLNLFLRPVYVQLLRIPKSFGERDLA